MTSKKNLLFGCWLLHEICASLRWLYLAAGSSAGCKFLGKSDSDYGTWVGNYGKPAEKVSHLKGDYGIWADNYGPELETVATDRWNGKTCQLRQGCACGNGVLKLHGDWEGIKFWCQLGTHACSTKSSYKMCRKENYVRGCQIKSKTMQGYLLVVHSCKLVETLPKL
jgi:hypothetical protein